MPTLIEINELRDRFQEMLGRASAGDEVIVTDQSVPKARLMPLSARVAGLHPGAFVPAQNFDEELPDAFWLGQQ
jgi:prevent-host-death family protein